MIQESRLIARKGWNVHLQEPFHMEIHGLLDSDFCPTDLTISQALL